MHSKITDKCVLVPLSVSPTVGVKLFHIQSDGLWSHYNQTAREKDHLLKYAISNQGRSYRKRFYRLYMFDKTLTTGDTFRNVATIFRHGTYSSCDMSIKTIHSISVIHITTHTPTHEHSRNGLSYSGFCGQALKAPRETGYLSDWNACAQCTVFNSMPDCSVMPSKHLFKGEESKTVTWLQHHKDCSGGPTYCYILTFSVHCNYFSQGKHLGKAFWQNSGSLSIFQVRQCIRWRFPTATNGALRSKSRVEHFLLFGHLFKLSLWTTNKGDKGFPLAQMVQHLLGPTRDRDQGGQGRSGPGH